MENKPAVWVRALAFVLRPVVRLIIIKQDQLRDARWSFPALQNKTLGRRSLQNTAFNYGDIEPDSARLARVEREIQLDRARSKTNNPVGGADA